MTDHDKLTGRDKTDQHPMSAITGLVDALAGKQPTGAYLTEETDPTVPAWAKAETKPSYTAHEVGADPAGTAAAKVSTHNTEATAHGDIRLLIQGLTDRLNALADSDDTTLDQLSEIVAYIKRNRTLIEAITTSKVSVADIIDNLTTNVTNKPLSAAQGVALKAMIDAITIPTALPNPNALTFTGAVSGSYDGSAPLEVEIPSGGGASGDYIPNPSTASVGQTIVVKAVDENGKPTEWEAVDMASGGIDWQLVDSKTLPAENSVYELEWTGLDCDSLYFSARIEYGANITCTGVYVNGVLTFKDWYQFQHSSAIMTNTVLISKMPERYRTEAKGSYLQTNVYGENFYATYEGKIDSIKFVFEKPFTKPISLSLYKG